MTTIRTRSLRVVAALGAAAAVLLSGCGIGLPTEAATVGDDSISSTQVNTLADGICTGWTDLGQSLRSLGRMRGDAAYGLAQRAMADQIAQEYGVTVSSSYSQIVAQATSGLPTTMSKAAVDQLVEVYLAGYYLQDISESAARAALADAGVGNPDQAQIQNRAESLRAEWLADHPITFDPKLGITYADQQPTRGGDTSYAVSDLAKAGAATEESPATVQALPADQRCGGAGA